MTRPRFARPDPRQRRLSRSALVFGLLLASCRGDPSSRPPLHLNDNMDQQDYIEPQEPSALFEDGRGMREPVAGTIARGELKDNLRFHQGKWRGQWIRRLPVRLDRRTLARGRQRYEVFCAPCHGYSGDARNSVMTRRSMTVPAPSYLEPRLRAMPVGQIYDAIKSGVRSMPAYLDRIAPGDRWAVAAYVRALQIAGSQPLERVPRAIVEQQGWDRR